MFVSAREDDGEKIQSNAPPQVSSLVPFVSWGVLGTKANDALIRMMGHSIGQWFDRYVGATLTSSHRHRDKLIRQEEMVIIVEVS